MAQNRLFPILLNNSLSLQQLQNIFFGVQAWPSVYTVCIEKAMVQAAFTFIITKIIFLFESGIGPLVNETVKRFMCPIVQFVLRVELRFAFVDRVRRNGVDKFLGCHARLPSDHFRCFFAAQLKNLFGHLTQTTSVYYYSISNI